MRIVVKSLYRFLKTYHNINFGVQLRVFDHSDEENSTSQRVSYVRQFRLARLFENITDNGGNVIVSYFVPADENDEPIFKNFVITHVVKALWYT